MIINSIDQALNTHIFWNVNGKSTLNLGGSAYCKEVENKTPDVSNLRTKASKNHKSNNIFDCCNSQHYRDSQLCQNLSLGSDGMTSIATVQMESKMMKLRLTRNHSVEPAIIDEIGNKSQKSKNTQKYTNNDQKKESLKWK